MDSASQCWESQCHRRDTGLRAVASSGSPLSKTQARQVSVPMVHRSQYQGPLEALGMATRP